MNDNYLRFLQEEAGPDSLKRIPWRSTTVKLDFAKTDLKGLKQECFVLNDLKFIFTWKPSFMFVVPDMKVLQTVNGATNGWIVAARKAQQLEYTKIESGSCYAKTMFFGNPKEGRSFDLFQRIFETGFIIENINGISMFSNNSVIEITVSSKKYSTPSPITGSQRSTSERVRKGTKTVIEEKNNILIPMRIKRVK